jgi:octaprenyl-diphosphate synthase
MSINAAKPDENSLAPWITAVQEEMQAVEHRLSDLIFSEVPTLFRVSDHLLSAGGKRLRPALVALCAKAAGGPYNIERVVNVGAAIEMIHMATLMHDDVIDQTDIRRGRATANSFWGNKISVLSGDYLLSKAFLVLAGDADTEILETLASTSVAMSESEVLQAVCQGDFKLWREHYLAIVRGKTAGFFASCCKCGAIIGGGGTEVQEALHSYGMQLGIVFQITDDLLDIAGSPSETGKALGTDLREGKFTLPVLLILDNAPDEMRESLLDTLRHEELSDGDIAVICDAAQRSGAIQMTKDTAASYAQKAVESLKNLPDREVLTQLKAVAAGMTYRER